MKRLVLCMASVCAVSLLSGCCWPGFWWGSPFGGCQNGACHPGAIPGQTGYYQGSGTVQTGYPGTVQGPVAITPHVQQQVAYPQPVYSTRAMESLPTYR